MASSDMAGYDRPVSPLSVDEPASPPPTVTDKVKVQDTTVTDNLLPKDGVDGNEQQVGILTYRRTSKAVLVDIVVVAVMASVAMCVAFGLILHIELNTRKGFTHSEPIGGRFSSIWAKLIDVGCSVVIAPGLLALANWYIFKLVRLCSISQGAVGDRPVNLKALSELAGTDWGSYSPLKHWTFVRTRDPRLICLATVALLSALSFSFLTNVTAYEAIGFSVVNITHTVEPLYGPRDNAPSQIISDIPDSAQNIELSTQLTRSLHNIPPEIGTTNTSHQAVLNVSSQSLSRISKSAKRLFNVPAYQLAASCKPADIRDFRVQFDSRRGSYAEYHLSIKMASKLTDLRGGGKTWPRC